MLRPIVLIAISLAALPAEAKTERRCGWFHTPTPGNVYLEDADGQWWISTQGNPSAPGYDAAYTPAFDDRVRVDYTGQVITDGRSYGFSCACVDGTFGAPGSQEVRSIARLKALPMAKCEADPNLPPVELAKP